MRIIVAFSILSMITGSTSCMLLTRAIRARPPIGPRIFVRYSGSSLQQFFDQQKIARVREAQVLLDVKRKIHLKNMAVGVSGSGILMASQMFTETVDVAASCAVGASLTATLMTINLPTIWKINRRIAECKGRFNTIEKIEENETRRIQEKRKNQNNH